MTLQNLGILTLILKALLNPLAKKPPNGPIREAKVDSAILWIWNGYIRTVFCRKKKKHIREGFPSRTVLLTSCPSFCPNQALEQLVFKWVHVPPDLGQLLWVLNPHRSSLNSPFFWMYHHPLSCSFEYQQNKVLVYFPDVPIPINKTSIRRQSPTQPTTDCSTKGMLYSCNWNSSDGSQSTVKLLVSLLNSTGQVKHRYPDIT